jgi:LuxR family maltose regulon positive regulatory protein
MEAVPTLPFAATKIQPPRPRRSRLPRPALEAALADSLTHCRAVVLQAPAGFGKTSLLASLTQPVAGGRALAWVSLDEDDDEQRFFACLCAALEPFDLPWRIAPEALAAQIGQGGGTSGVGQRALTELLNALAGAEVTQGVIVVDDLHRAEPGGIHALIEALIERLPAPWVVVLASRVLPPLPLARWRAAGELALFDQDRLAFSAEEATALAVAEGAPERAAELFERTRGWPAGLRLLLTAPLRGSQRPALDREVFDFLAAEVLDDMPLRLHDFLLRVAVLPEMTVPRAAAVSGDAQAAERFDEIERRGLFATVLDADERTLVLHDLFREALLDRLRRRWPELEPRLLERAAASETDPVRRVGYLLRARDWPAAEAALAEAAPGLLLAGGLRELLRLIDAFDAGWREHSPRLQRLLGMVDTLRWDWEPMARHLRAAIEAARRLGDRDEQDLAEACLAGALYPLDQNAEGEVLIAGLLARPVAPAARRQALMADCSQLLRLGRMAELPLRYAEVLDLLEAQNELFAWWECVPPFNWTTVPGLQPLLERYVQGALARIGGRPLPLRADVKLLRVFARLWQGGLDEAALEADGVESDRRWLCCSGELELGLTIYRLIVATLRGRGDEVAGHLQTLFVREDGAAPDRQRLWRHHMAIYGVRMSDTLAADDRAAAIAHWAAHLKEDPLRSAAFDNHRAIGVRARHAAASGRWAEAAQGFARLLPLLGNLDVMGHAMDLRLRAAHALWRAGRADEAAAALQPALQRLVDEGVRGQALLAGPEVLAELAAARWPASWSPGWRAELAAAAAQAAELRRGPVLASGAQPEAGAGDEGPLSAREREVLALMAAGDSNKHIARALDISPHTVKRHVANILDKLGLASRGQAAAWFRDHA